MRLLAINLAKDCRFVLGRTASAVDRDFRIEGELGAGQNAYCRTGVTGSSEPARAGAEICRSKFVADARGT